MTFSTTDRLKTFKKTVDEEDGRRRREETVLNIRKQKKDERLAKRRHGNRTEPAGEVAELPNGQEKKMSTVTELPQLVAAIKDTKGLADPLIEATRSIRRMLSVSQNPPVKQVVDAGALPYLVELLMRTDSYALQFEASWALTNVASTNYTAAVADQPRALEYLISLLRSPNEDVREQCAWCLGNIAGDGPQFRDAILRLGAVDPL
jgi:importin subunit alpha-1